MPRERGGNAFNFRINKIRPRRAVVVNVHKTRPEKIAAAIHRHRIRHAQIPIERHLRDGEVVERLVLPESVGR